MRPRLPVAYVELLEKGAFPGQIDPWAEAGRYFHQIHAGMIGYLLEQIQNPLQQLGYFAGRETSLTITERSKPDIFVERSSETPIVGFQLDYSTAAESIQAISGLALESAAMGQEAIFIDEMDTGRLITVVELISPRNKTSPQEILEYQNRRWRLLGNGVNFVEIDLTRSLTRLMDAILMKTYPYHVLVYLPGKIPQLIGIELAESLPRIALPLETDVIPVDLQPAYTRAYEVAGIAAQIRDHQHYNDAHLPFPTTLTSTQRQQIRMSVDAWQAALKRLLEHKAE